LIEVEINEKKEPFIKCPSCFTVLEPPQVKRFSTRKLYQSYRTILREADLLLSIPCYKCDTWHQIESELVKPYIICRNCKRKTCVEHRLKWHGMKCRQLTKQEAIGTQWKDKLLKWREILSEDWKSNHTKICPSCKTPIEKWAGCNHVHCSFCQRSFSWSSADPYLPSENSEKKM